MSELAIFILIIVLILLGCLSCKYKKKMLNKLAKSLDARISGDVIVGKFDEFEYIISFMEGHSGGAVTGPTRVGYPSSMRVIVEEYGLPSFHIYAKSWRKRPFNLNLENAEIFEFATQKLFDMGFKEIECDGKTLEVIIYPMTLDDNLNNGYFEKVFLAVGNILNTLKNNVAKLD